MKNQIKYAEEKIEFFNRACSLCHVSMKAYYQSQLSNWKKELEKLLIN